jgi:SAM-dependent methyltransferase
MTRIPSPSVPELLAWREGLAEFDLQNMRYLLATIATVGIPGSYLDIGCGSGAMVKIADAMGIKSHGVDQIPNEPEPLFTTADLRDPLKLGQAFELVTCVEVAEHIDPEFQGVLVRNVARHVSRSGCLVFTAAHPGQIGHGHVNCRPAYDWRTWFGQTGLNYSPSLTQALVIVWTYARLQLPWLPANLQVFTGPKWTGILT